MGRSQVRECGRFKRLLREDSAVKRGSRSHSFLQPDLAEALDRLQAHLRVFGASFAIEGEDLSALEHRGQFRIRVYLPIDSLMKFAASSGQSDRMPSL